MNSRSKNTQLVMDAAENGDILTLQRLVGTSRKRVNDDALWYAAKNGHAECVKLLIPVSNPTSANSRALGLAALNGHAECVRLLLPVSKPVFNDSSYLQWAATNGHSECVRLLIPVVDVKAASSRALMLASFYKRPECIDLLFDASDPKAALQSIQSQYPYEPERWQYLEDKIDLKQRETLIREINDLPIKPTALAHKI